MTDERVEVAPGVIRNTPATGGRWYEIGGTKYPSVNSILDVLHSIGLSVWKDFTNARFTVANYDFIGQQLREGLEDEAVRLIARAADRERDEKAAIGTEVHAAAEAIALGHEPTEPSCPEVAEMVRYFRDFLETMRPEYVMTEAPVFHEPHGYAGTLDAVAAISLDRFNDQTLGHMMRSDTWDVATWRKHPRNVQFVIDYTTGRGVYESKALQVTAYRHARTVALPDGSFPVLPYTHGGFVLQLRPSTERDGAGGWRLVPVDTSPKTMAVFLAVRDVHRWLHGDGKTVVGDAMNLEAVTS